MNPFEILRAVAEAFLENPVVFAVRLMVLSLLLYVLGIVVWQMTIPSLLEFYGLVG